MNWDRANDAQSALTATELHFLAVCDTAGELDEEEVKAAYAAMAQASWEADEALEAIPRWRF